MFVLVVQVHVKQEHIEDFKEAILENARGTRQEPGNLRFDVNQSLADPEHFVLYEVYRDEEALKAHQQTPHYQTWRDRVASWMAVPRQGTRLQSLFPEDETDW